MDDPVHILTNCYARTQFLFGRTAAAIELDLGTGKGSFLMALAARYPERLVVGTDVMLRRLRKVAGKVRRAGLENVELLRAESLELVGYQLPPGSVHRVHLLCPDPWPKTRHRARRLVTTDFLQRLARIMAPGAVFHVATDDPDYSEEVGAAVAACQLFAPDPDGVTIADIADLSTDFECRWLAQGRQVVHCAHVRQ